MRYSEEPPIRQTRMTFAPVIRSPIDTPEMTYSIIYLIGMTFAPVIRSPADTPEMTYSIIVVIITTTS